MLFELECGPLHITFPAVSGGLPGRVTVTEGDGRETLLFDNSGWQLEAELENGIILHPVATGKELFHYSDDKCEHVDFLNLHFRDQNGNDYPDHYMTLRHEFYPDGTAFCNMFFFVRDIHTPGIVRFELTAKPDFSTFNDVRWSYLPRPVRTDGTVITAPTKRFLKPEGKYDFQQIMPMMTFNMFRKFAPSMYVEFFVEGQSTLSAKNSDADSSVCWDGNSPSLRWSFQNKPFPRPLISQLRNQWGWAVRPAQTVRHLPPYRMYHYFENYKRYPDDEEIAAITASGCDIFIIHENWRSDTQNDGCPFDVDAFIKLRDALHAAGIRMAVYIRGCEESVVMRQANWFRRLLTYNFDGLYMDYGGPFHTQTPPDESYCGGRLNFREYYMIMSRLRDQVGPDGVLFSHTGPSFSGLSMPFMTGYVSGEGERGMLIRGRLEHEYFSMAAVCPGTLWSAAFPEYSSPRIVPFIAAASQYPHSALGEQFLSSSLVHPRVPGINDRAFVNLWKLWSVIRREKDITVINDYNSSAVFQQDSDTGHVLFIPQTGNYALLILSNFDEKSRDVNVATDFKRAGFAKNPARVTLLKNGTATALDEYPEFVTLDGNGVAGLLLTPAETAPETLLQGFLKPEPELSECGKEYLKRVEKQRSLRENPPLWDKIFMRIVMPEISPTPYEDSMTLDLFNNSFEFGMINGDGTFSRICWIDRNGVNYEHSEKENLFAGDTSPVIDLAQFDLHGKQKMALRSTHYGEPFYSFCYLDFSPTADFNENEFYRIEFLNDLEPDRAFLKFFLVFK